MFVVKEDQHYYWFICACPCQYWQKHTGVDTRSLLNHAAIEMSKVGHGKKSTTDKHFIFKMNVSSLYIIQVGTEINFCIVA